MTLVDALEGALPLPHSHVGGDGPLTADYRIKVEATMQLDELLASVSPALHPSDVAGLVDWIVQLVAGARRDAVLEAVGDVETLELSQAAIVELAAAHATFVEIGGQVQRLTQVRAILKRGMTLTESYDLANTLEAEVDALRGRLSGILGKYPELEQLMSPDVVSRSASLVTKDGAPIV